MAVQSISEFLAYLDSLDQLAGRREEPILPLTPEDPAEKDLWNTSSLRDDYGFQNTRLSHGLLTPLLPDYAAISIADAALDRPAAAEQQAAFYAIPFDKRPNDSDQNVDGLISGRAWNTTSLTYSFPDGRGDYEPDYYDIAVLSSIQQFNADQIAAAKDAFAQ